MSLFLVPGQVLKYFAKTLAFRIVFIVPRNDNILILGGITQMDEWTLDLTLESPVIQRMYERCLEFLPSLRHARLDPTYPLAQGLRPFRGANVRVERELRKPISASGGPHSVIVHNYGHGGSGWSFAFGCAEDVAALIDEVLEGIAPKAMGSGQSTPLAVVVPEELSPNCESQNHLVWIF